MEHPHAGKEHQLRTGPAIRPALERKSQSVSLLHKVTRPVIDVHPFWPAPCMMNSTASLPHSCLPGGSGDPPEDGEELCAISAQRCKKPPAGGQPAASEPPSGRPRSGAWTARPLVAGRVLLVARGPAGDVGLRRVHVVPAWSLSRGCRRVSPFLGRSLLAAGPSALLLETST